MTDQSARDTSNDAADAIDRFPPFRLDNEQLAFRFTATLSDRYGTPTERLPSPERLDEWLTVNELTIGNHHASIEDLDLAYRLREAIHDAGTAIALAKVPSEAERELINRLLQEELPCPELTETGLRWRSATGNYVRGALSLIAHDAATLLGGPARGCVKACENPDCSGLYVDTSQAKNRRWCSMNICGNRAKKAKFRGPRTAAKASAPPSSSRR